MIVFGPRITDTAFDHIVGGDASGSVKTTTPTTSKTVIFIHKPEKKKPGPIATFLANGPPENADVDPHHAVLWDARARYEK